MEKSGIGPRKRNTAGIRCSCAVDPHHFEADPDSTHIPNADPHNDFYLRRIRKPIRMLIRLRFLFGVDPDPPFYPDADPDPSFQIKKTLKAVLQ
jgi:hypothetical protein